MRQISNKKMTLKEVSQVTGASYRTIARYAQKFGWTQDGKETMLDKVQVTKILEGMKEPHVGEQPCQLIGKVTTDLSRAVRIAEFAKKRQEIGDQIEAELQAEVAELKEKAERLTIRLSEADKWWTVKRVMIQTQKEYDWVPLKRLSKKLGYEIKKTFDQNYGEINAYHVESGLRY
jgi:predicted DNA binding CopG/RHH family protein